MSTENHRKSRVSRSWSDLEVGGYEGILGGFTARNASRVGGSVIPGSSPSLGPPPRPVLTTLTARHATIYRHRMHNMPCLVLPGQAEGVNPLAVVRQRHQIPLPSHQLDPPQREHPEPQRRLDHPEHRFHRLLTQRMQLLPLVRLQLLRHLPQPPRRCALALASRAAMILDLHRSPPLRHCLARRFSPCSGQVQLTRFIRAHDGHR